MLPELEPEIDFYAEDLAFDLPAQTEVKQWLITVAASEHSDIQELTFIFCSDAYLLELNQQYLEHDTLTDVITFDYAEESGVVEGDVFISVERTRENAAEMGVAHLQELHRVMVHGLLHLLGYTDKTDEEKATMRTKEDFYLNLRPFSVKEM